MKRFSPKYADIQGKMEYRPSFPLSFSPKSDALLCGLRPTMWLWKLGKPNDPLDSPLVLCCQFSPEGTQFLTGHISDQQGGALVRLWNEGGFVRGFTGPAAAILSATFRRTDGGYWGRVTTGP